jgi:hypothetical protein
MRLNVKQHVLDYEGKPLLTDKTNSDGSPMLDENHRPVKEPETLRSYLVLALNNKSRAETEPLGAEEAAKRYQLSTKLYAKSEVDLTHSECAAAAGADRRDLRQPAGHRADRRHLGGLGNLIARGCQEGRQETGWRRVAKSSRAGCSLSRGRLMLGSSVAWRRSGERWKSTTASYRCRSTSTAPVSRRRRSG